MKTDAMHASIAPCCPRLLTLVVLFTNGCQPVDSEPIRPPALPDSAVFAGGIDGGDWISCEATSDNRILCTVFDPNDGLARYEKSYRICPAIGQARTATQTLLRPRFIDAKVLLLDGVPGYVDRPATYLPHRDDTPADIERELELATKYFENYGVTSDCKPIAK